MKKARKLLVLIAAMVMVLGISITAAAASLVPKVSSFSTKSSVTVYTNEGENVVEIPVKVTWTKPATDTHEDAVVSTATSNRGVVKVSDYVATSTTYNSKKKNYTTTGTITLTALKNGTATVTVYDTYNTGKKAKIKVTVKTKAKSVDTTLPCYTVAKGGKVSTYYDLWPEFGNENAVSSQGATYKVDDKKIATVDAKGVVKGVKVGTTKVTITSKDKNASTIVDIVVTPAEVTGITRVVDGKELTAKQNVNVTLQTNPQLNNDSYEILLKVKTAADHEYDIENDLKFTSSNLNVARVSARGNVTAVGNGTATITVTPALGNSISAKYTIKVETKTDELNAPETFEILANKKAVSLGVTTNAKSSEAVSYKIASITDANGAEIAAKNFKNFLKVDKNGKLTALKGCTADIQVKSGSITKTIDVTAKYPVTGITYKNRNKYVSNASATVTRERTDWGGVVDVTSTPFADLKVSGDSAANKSVEYTSSNEDVAVIDADGVITTVGNGKAVLSVLATDGSGKKATYTLTVKTYAADISYDSTEMVTPEEGTPYEVLYVEPGKKVTLKSVLLARVDDVATDKTVKYSVSTVTLKNANDTKVITLTSGDKKISRKITVKAVDKATLSTNYSVTVVGEFDNVKKGETIDLSASVNANDEKEILDQPVTWSSTDAKIATVSNTGVVKGIKAGKATIKATFKQAGQTVTGSFDVIVGRSDAEVKATLDAAFTKALADEDRSYLGAKTKFTAKTGKFDIDITAPKTTIAEWSDTGLSDVFTSLPATIEAVIFEDCVNAENSLLLTRTDEGMAVYDGSWEVFDTKAQVVDYVKEYFIKDTTLEDWNGSQYVIAVASVENGLEYFTEYTLEASISDSLFDSMLDDNVYTAISEAYANKTDDIAGEAANASFDAATNTITIDVLNEELQVAAVVEQLRDDFVSERATIDRLDEKYHEDVISFKNKLDTVTISAYEKGDDGYFLVEERTITNIKNRGEKDIDDIDPERQFSEKNQGRLEAHTLAEAANYKVVANATYKVGYKEYNYQYTVRFTVGKGAIDFKADKDIVAKLPTASANNYSYDKDANELTITFANGENTFGNVNDTDSLGAIFLSIVSDNGAAKAEFVSTKNVIKTLEGDDIKDRAKVLNALTGTTASGKVSEVADETATIRVTYVVDGKEVKIDYTINFKVKLDESASNNSYDDTEDDVSGNDVSDNDVSAN